MYTFQSNSVTNVIGRREQLNRMNRDDLVEQGVNAFLLAEAIGGGGSGSGSAGGGTIGVGSVVGLDASRGMLEVGWGGGRDTHTHTGHVRSIG